MIRYSDPRYYECNLTLNHEIAFITPILYSALDKSAEKTKGIVIMILHYTHSLIFLRDCHSELTAWSKENYQVRHMRDFSTFLIRFAEPFVISLSSPPTQTEILFKRICVASLQLGSIKTKHKDLHDLIFFSETMFSKNTPQQIAIKLKEILLAFCATKKIMLRLLEINADILVKNFSVEKLLPDMKHWLSDEVGGILNESSEGFALCTRMATVMGLLTDQLSPNKVAHLHKVLLLLREGIPTTVASFREKRQESYRKVLLKFAYDLYSQLNYLDIAFQMEPAEKRLIKAQSEFVEYTNNEMIGPLEKFFNPLMQAFLKFHRQCSQAESSHAPSQPLVDAHIEMSETFSMKCIEWNAAYSFFYQMLNSQIKNLDLVSLQNYIRYFQIKDAPSLLTSVEFSELSPEACHLSARLEDLAARDQEWREICAIDAPEPSPSKLDQSYIPTIKKNPPTPAKKKKKIDSIELLLQRPQKEAPSSSSSSSFSSKPPSQPKKKRMGGHEILGPRHFDLRALTYDERVEKYLNAQKVTGKGRENVWAHGFTQQLDHFLGTSYCFTYKQEKQTHHAFIVLVEDLERGKEKVPYVATYTMDEKGICYHRCLMKKTRHHIFNALEKKRLYDLFEFPSLQQAAAQKKSKARVEPKNSFPFTLDSISGIVTVRDLKHNLILEVIPYKE